MNIVSKGMALTGKKLYNGYYDPKRYYEETPEYLMVYVKEWNRHKQTDFKVGDRVVIVGRSTKKIRFYRSQEGVIKKINSGGPKIIGFVDLDNKKKDVELYNEVLEFIISLKGGTLNLTVQESDIELLDSEKLK